MPKAFKKVLDFHGAGTITVEGKYPNILEALVMTIENEFIFNQDFATTVKLMIQLEEGMAEARKKAPKSKKTKKGGMTER